MENELHEAMNILAERKLALGMSPDKTSDENRGNVESLALLLMGMDLDANELIYYATHMGGDAVQRHLTPIIDEEMNPKEFLIRMLEFSASLWIDGTLTGVILEQQRKKESSRDSPSSGDDG